MGVSLLSIVLAGQILLAASDYSALDAGLVYGRFFETTSLINRNHWDLDASASQGGHNEFQIYSPESHNCYTHNGHMYLKPTLTSDKFGLDFLFHGTLDVKKQWGYCNPTWNNVSFKYGKLEIMAKMPKGDWLWPALWLMPKHGHYGGWPRSGEIDVAELLGNTNYGSLGIQRTTASLHFGNDRSHDKHLINQHWLHGSTYGDGFHKYTLDWSPSHINIYIDNTLILGTPMPGDGLHHHYGLAGNNIWGSSHNAPFDQDFYIIMNVAVGGTGGIFPDSVRNYPHPKPWSNHQSSGVAMQNFWNHKNDWLSTWHGEDAAMKVDSVTIWTY
ncbi:beta-1,3-glucan-binding protein-like [Liolophura sinensis]|uniref:beta-1,3-glucan-binding protein-like n=1 Tax=Liolophura sinensis TaxID=3198878 RepID=UPI003158AEF4